MKAEEAVSNKKTSEDGATLCFHDEADTQMFVHVSDATGQGSKCLIV